MIDPQIKILIDSDDNLEIIVAGEAIFNGPLSDEASAIINGYIRMGYELQIKEK